MSSLHRLAILLLDWAGTHMCLLARGTGYIQGKQFKDPPESARPRVDWQWMNGNVTEEGISADLEWMKRVGIEGVQTIDVGLGMPQLTERRLAWMTPEWKEAIAHAAAEADGLGLEMTMAAGPGWSGMGAPFVTPEAAMKKFVWSETEVRGPAKFAGTVLQPPSTTGPHQDIPRPRALPPPMSPNTVPQASARPPVLYRDSAVVAYRTPDGPQRMADFHPKVTAWSGEVDAAVLMDGAMGTTVPLPKAAEGEPAWIQFEFARPYTAYAFTLAMAPVQRFGAAIPKGRVLASVDGRTFATLVALPGPEHHHNNLPVRTFAFPKTTARFFRVEFAAHPVGAFDTRAGLKPDRPFAIAEIEFAAAPRVHRFEEKSGFGNLFDCVLFETPAVADEEAIASGDVIDLTSRLRPDGTIDWEVPDGAWTILRMGYSLTGAESSPAVEEATGLEVDKLSRKHVATHLNRYLDELGDAAPYFGRSLRSFLIDSWEAGQENWTDDLIAEFGARRGYDPRPYLPVLTRRVVGNADVSDRILWDFRRTLAEMLADNFYGTVAGILHGRDMSLYAEAMGAQLPTVGDALQLKGRVDVPIGEFWAPAPGQTNASHHLSDIREAASAAHIYGKTVVAAEAFTSFPAVPGWGQGPNDLKPLADFYFSLGVNRIVFHPSVHQPFVDDTHRPGLTLWGFGQHEPWTGEAFPNTHMGAADSTRESRSTRCSLQLGRRRIFSTIPRTSTRNWCGFIGAPMTPRFILSRITTVERKQSKLHFASPARRRSCGILTLARSNLRPMKSRMNAPWFP